MKCIVLALFTVTTQYTIVNPNCSVGTNEKSDFYELWQLCKQLKTMEMTSSMEMTSTMEMTAEALRLKVSSHGTSLK